MAMTTQKILIVDDDRSIAKAICGYLEQAGFQVLSVYDGESALHMVRSEKPDLLILDLMLPDRDGWDITRILRADRELCNIPIIMLTARVDDMDKIIGLELGADDYITKPFNSREVVARARAILRRGQHHNHLSEPIMQVGRLELDRQQHILFVDGARQNLTPTEFKLLQIFMENQGHTFNREELLEACMGYAYEGMGRTLDTHIRNLRLKIERDPNQPEYIETVYSIGYRFAGGN